MIVMLNLRKTDTWKNAPMCPFSVSGMADIHIITNLQYNKVKRNVRRIIPYGRKR